MQGKLKSPSQIPKSDLVQIGVGGEDAPRSVFRTLVAFDDHDAAYVGDDAFRRRQFLEVHEPMKHGIITDHEAIEKLLDHAFINEIGLSPDLRPFLWTERPFIPRPGNSSIFFCVISMVQILTNRKVREKTVEILFEKYRIPAGYVAI